MTQAIPPNQSASPVLWGEYRCSLDSDGYLLLPAQFSTTTPFVLTKGLDGCLMLAPQSYFSSLSEKVRALPISNQLGRLFRRHLFAHALQVIPDEKRQIFVPDALRTYAGLSDEVILVGNDVYLEIWNVNAWLEKQARLIDEAISQEDWQLEGI
jgi:MraZ protein